MQFEIIPPITNVQTIARGRGVKARGRLNKKYGTGKWRKMKGLARVRFENGILCQAEIHWYEANGIGRKDYKIKRLLP